MGRVVNVCEGTGEHGSGVPTLGSRLFQAGSSKQGADCCEQAPLAAARPKLISPHYCTSLLKCPPSSNKLPIGVTIVFGRKKPTSDK